MNKDQLGYFLLVYRTKSIAEAAAAIPMSPQGLNKSIRSLEQELGVALFDIDANGNRVPTRYADAFATCVDRVDAEFNAVEHEFERIRAEDSSTVRIAASLGFSGFAGQACVDAFHQEHPGIFIQMNELTDHLCDSALIDGIVDLAFTLTPFDEKLATTALFRERVYFWVNAKDPLAAKEQLTLEDLDGQTIASFGEGLKLHERLLQDLEAANVKPANIVCSPEAFWHYQEAMRGNALGLTVEHLAKSDVFTLAPNVVAIPIDVWWEVGISRHPNRPLTDQQQTFWTFAVRHFSQ